MTVHKSTKVIRTDWVDLPDAVRTYLAAHRVRDVDTAIATFTADAVVTDEGRTYRGRDEIVDWLGAAAREYTFTTDFTDATVTGGAYADVVQHLEGDFPGGVADLHFRFTLDGGLISRLIIEP
ncbi:nuclear transport factor 2 family protein [Mycolicibacterium baixiangningiae]|uniref:nuclear transport factor 2 family protein n=1 Tax=Mycolicibacterium baixiangningiae TaxID=2761578 RepID=UPI001866B79D|nr:nuclear transport factor 2 family protein [Mycolicibacterium baixiangningiae]